MAEVRMLCDKESNKFVVKCPSCGEQGNINNIYDLCDYCSDQYWKERGDNPECIFLW